MKNNVDTVNGYLNAINADNKDAYMLCYEIANRIDARSFDAHLPQEKYVDILERIESDLSKAEMKVMQAIIRGRRQFDAQLYNAYKYFSHKISIKYGWELRRLERSKTPAPYTFAIERAWEDARDEMYAY